MAEEENPSSKFTRKLTEIANDTNKKLENYYNSDSTDQVKRVTLNNLKKSTKEKVAKEVTDFFKDKNVQLEVVFNERKSAFVLQPAFGEVDDYVNSIKKSIKEDNVSPDMKEKLTGLLFPLHNISNHMEELEKELNSQLGLMNEYIDSTIDTYNKKDFNKKFVGGVTLATGIILSVIATIAIAFPIMLIPVVISAGGLGAALSGIAATAALFSVELQSMGLVAAGAALVGLVGTAISDKINNNKNVSSEEILQNKSRNFLVAMNDVAQDLLSTTNSLIKEDHRLYRSIERGLKTEHDSNNKPKKQDGKEISVLASDPEYHKAMKGLRSSIDGIQKHDDTDKEISKGAKDKVSESDKLRSEDRAKSSKTFKNKENHNKGR